MSSPCWAPHLQGSEQEVIQAPCVNGVHHVTDQMDLSSQVLDSAKEMMRKRVLLGKPLVAGALDT